MLEADVGGKDKTRHAPRRRPGIPMARQPFLHTFAKWTPQTKGRSSLGFRTRHASERSHLSPPHHPSDRTPVWCPRKCFLLDETFRRLENRITQTVACGGYSRTAMPCHAMPSRSSGARLHQNRSV